MAVNSCRDSQVFFPLLPPPVPFRSVVFLPLLLLGFLAVCLEVFSEFWAVGLLVTHLEAVVALSHRAVYLGVAALLADVAVSSGVELEAKVDLVLFYIHVLAKHCCRPFSLLGFGLLEVTRRRQLHVEADEIERVEGLARFLDGLVREPAHFGRSLVLHCRRSPRLYGAEKVPHGHKRLGFAIEAPSPRGWPCFGICAELFLSLHLDCQVGRFEGLGPPAEEAQYARLIREEIFIVLIGHLGKLSIHHPQCLVGL
mmetsp:Transcript_68957/g.155978  ORF Transcript_68957/g.155978 Transcript_68957/m.155978 type:complete len:255 (+) Transcript_68957:559-1323(+)